MPDSSGFDVFGYFQWHDSVFCLFEYSAGSWVTANDGVKIRHVFDDVIFPIFVAVEIRECIDSELYPQCFQYLGDHHLPLFVGEWIFYGMFFVWWSYAYNKLSYSFLPCLIQSVDMSKMKRLETADEQSCFLSHKKILVSKSLMMYTHCRYVCNLCLKLFF